MDTYLVSSEQHCYFPVISGLFCGEIYGFSDGSGLIGGRWLHVKGTNGTVGLISLLILIASRVYDTIRAWGLK